MLPAHDTPRVPRLLAAGALVLALGACAEELAPEKATTQEAEFAEQVQALRKGGQLPAPGPTATPEGAPTFFAALDELDALLAQTDPKAGEALTWWDEKTWPALEERLAPLQAYYDRVTALVTGAAARAALKQGGSLAYRTSIYAAKGAEGAATAAGAEPVDLTYDRFATPSLARTGRWVNLLCARAIDAGRSESGAEVATQSLADAFDLLALLDDHSAKGTATCAALEQNLLRALQIVAPGPTVDPQLMRKTIDPRLARIGDKKRMWNYLRDTVAWRVGITEVLLLPKPRADSDHWLAELDCSRTRLAQRGLDILYVFRELRGASETCARLALFGTSHPFQVIIDGMKKLHDLSVESYLARYGLALNEYRFVNGQWPTFISDLDPTFPKESTPFLICNELRKPDTKQSYNDYRLFLPTRQRAATEASLDPLLEWRWNSQVLQQFEDRSR